MKFKKVFILIGICNLILLTSIASAMSFYSNINIENGMARIKYIVNNETGEIEIDSSGRIEINANNSDFDYKINEAGECTSENNVNADIGINANVDEKEETISSNYIYILVFCFILLFVMILVKKIIISGRGLS